jgi:disulfide bond formation protein DsbB
MLKDVLNLVQARATPRNTALFLALMLLGILAGAWTMQLIGYVPCDLCYLERWAYYAGIPFALLLFALNPGWIRPGLVLLGLVLVANAILGGWHAGIEWNFWKGPASCTSDSLSGGLPNLTQHIVLCNEAALRIFGISLAGWNAICCAGLAAIAFYGARHKAA